VPCLRIHSRNCFLIEVNSFRVPGTITFSLPAPNNWENVDVRRAFLRDFAAKENFDPMQADLWRAKVPKLRSYGVSHTSRRILISKYSYLLNDFVGITASSKV